MHFVANRRSQVNPVGKIAEKVAYRSVFWVPN